MDKATHEALRRRIIIKVAREVAAQYVTAVREREARELTKQSVLALWLNGPR